GYAVPQVANRLTDNKRQKDGRAVIQEYAQDAPRVLHAVFLEVRGEWAQTFREHQFLVDAILPVPGAILPRPLRRRGESPSHSVVPERIRASQHEQYRPAGQKYPATTHLYEYRTSIFMTNDLQINWPRNSRW